MSAHIDSKDVDARHKAGHDELSKLFIKVGHGIGGVQIERGIT
jgi:hypothetical protein